LKAIYAEVSMPIYEFRCTKCGIAFEVKRPFSESSAPATCPSCGGSGEKLASVFASTAGFGIKLPDKDALREPLRRKPSRRARE
jgi:putative FmdB family regulatory protein